MSEAQGRVTRLLPIVGWLRTYDRSWLRGDLIAGLTEWAVLVPEALAEASMSAPT